MNTAWQQFTTSGATRGDLLFARKFGCYEVTQREIIKLKIERIASKGTHFSSRRSKVVVMIEDMEGKNSECDILLYKDNHMGDAWSISCRTRKSAPHKAADDSHSHSDMTALKFDHKVDRFLRGMVVCKSASYKREVCCMFSHRRKSFRSSVSMMEKRSAWKSSAQQFKSRRTTWLEEPQKQGTVSCCAHGPQRPL